MFFFFFFNDTATTEIYTLSLHDALPIAIVRMPVKGRDGLVEVNSKKLAGKMSAGGTAGVNPSDYHLVALAMQEPQYRSPGVRELLAAVAKAKVPCMSIMNMPPLT